MALTKQARVLDDAAIKRMIAYAREGRYPERDLVMVLLSTKAGMRSKEIASLKWSMVMRPDGMLDNEITLINKATKGRSGRLIPMHPDIYKALLMLIGTGSKIQPDMAVVFSERQSYMTIDGVRLWFNRMYKTLGLDGCSSHSGRRTFITKVARAIGLAGGSMKDVQMLAGHANLGTTQLYIDENVRAKRKVVDGL